MLRAFFKYLFPEQYVTRSHTVRYAFPIVLVATLFAGLAAVITKNNSYVSIQTEVTTVAKEQQFTIDVHVNAHVPVNAVDLVISYPNEIVVDSIDTGTSVITLWTEEPYAKEGNIYLRGGTFRKGFIGEHTIARIKVHATKAGEAKLFLKDTQLVAGDGKGTEVSVAEAENEVRIAVTGSDGLIKGEAGLAIVTDIDSDGDVDLKDISSFMSAWFSRARIFDFNGDGKMTFKDFSILLAESFFE